MIKELVRLHKQIRERAASGGLYHDALKEEFISITCVIDNDGNFIEFLYDERKSTLAEAIAAKKGKARLLLDKAEEVLNFGNNEDKKHQLFLEKLNLYRHIQDLEPVIKFYENLKMAGIEKARKAYDPEQGKTGNIGFLVKGNEKRVHEYQSVYNAVIEKYEEEQAARLQGEICAVCGKADYPVEDEPHGMIKNVPSGQSSGCALISYNEKAFESYMLKGNENSSICSHCAKAYVEGLNWLMSNKMITVNDQGNEISKPTNRKNIGKDTAMVYWTRESIVYNELDILDEPNADEVTLLLESAYSGRTASVHIETNQFYGLTLSGAAARIAIRDWIEINTEHVRRNIVQWFNDIGIVHKGYVLFPSIYQMSTACRRGKKDNELAGRVGLLLWSAALKNSSVPIWVLSAVLGRLRAEHGKQDEKGKRIDSVTYPRAALVKLILNRHFQKGGKTYMATCDHTNTETAYLCGRAFAVLERIQYHALGETNTNIKDRFFNSASTTPGLAFGRLINLAQKHLSKLKSEKPGLSVTLDRELQQILGSIKNTSFPATFRLEEQGTFVLGYYHQKNKNLADAKIPMEDNHERDN